MSTVNNETAKRGKLYTTLDKYSQHLVNTFKTPEGLTEKEAPVFFKLKCSKDCTQVVNLTTAKDASFLPAFVLLHEEWNSSLTNHKEGDSLLDVLERHISAIVGTLDVIRRKTNYKKITKRVSLLWMLVHSLETLIARLVPEEIPSEFLQNQNVYLDRLQECLFNKNSSSDSAEEYNKLRSTLHPAFYYRLLCQMILDNQCNPSYPLEFALWGLLVQNKDCLSKNLEESVLHWVLKRALPHVPTLESHLSIFVDIASLTQFILANMGKATFDHLKRWAFQVQILRFVLFRECSQNDFCRHIGWLWEQFHNLNNNNVFGTCLLISPSSQSYLTETGLSELLQSAYSAPVSLLELTQQNIKRIRKGEWSVKCLDEKTEKETLALWEDMVQITLKNDHFRGSWAYICFLTEAAKWAELGDAKATYLLLYALEQLKTWRIVRPKWFKAFIMRVCRQDSLVYKVFAASLSKHADIDDIRRYYPHKKYKIHGLVSVLFAARKDEYEKPHTKTMEDPDLKMAKEWVAKVLQTPDNFPDCPFCLKTTAELFALHGAQKHSVCKNCKLTLEEQGNKCPFCKSV